MENSYRRFRYRLFARKEWAWRLMSCSLFERQLGHILMDPTDVDSLIWSPEICALPPGKEVPKHFPKRPTLLLTIHTGGVHPGFAKLLVGGNWNNFYRWQVLLGEETSSDDGRYEKFTNGPSLRKVIYNGWFSRIADERLLKILRLSDDKRNDTAIAVHDSVPAIYCPYWPPVAEEWENRNRNYGWPTEEDIKKIVSEGCYLVGKPHQSNPNDSTQCRFSFSNAETNLINSWNDVQKSIYQLLRLIKKEVVKSCGGEDSTMLCTYHFKTLMLWACEERPPQFWEESNIENSVGELLLQMIDWLFKKKCPNYFIPGNNMIDHFPKDIDLSNEITSLLFLKENSVNSMLTKVQEAVRPDEGLTISCPHKLLSYLCLMLSLTNFGISLDRKLSGRLQKRLANSIDHFSELKYIYLGISSHLKFLFLRNIRSSEDDCSLSSSILNYFDMAANFTYSGESELSVHSTDCLSTILDNVIAAGDTIVMPIKAKNRRKNTSCTLSVIRTCVEGAFRIIDMLIPAPSFFIASTYKANFLYTGLSDYSAAAKYCEEIRMLYEKMTKRVEKSFTRIFPILVTTEWSPLFDQHIQTCFGFVTILRNIWNDEHFINCSRPSYRTVVLYLRPLLFLEYIRLQCLRKLGRSTYCFRKASPSEIAVKPYPFTTDYDIATRVFLNAAFETSCR